MNRILIIALLLVFSLTAAWGQGYWEEALGPYGGEGILTEASNGKLFYRTNGSYQLFSSSDNGFAWKKVSNPPIDTSANNDDWIMAGEAGNLYKVLEYSDGQNHIYRSVDEGESWDLLIASDSILKLVETSNGALIAATSNRLLRSTDGGQTWSPTFGDTTNQEIGRLFIGNNGDVWAKYGNDYVLRSQNQGQSWTTIYAPYGIGNFSMHVTENGTIIYVGIGLYRSTNGGQTFQEITIDTSSNIQFGSFCNLLNGRILYTNIHPAGKRIFYSDNNGLNWYLLNTDYQARLLYNIRLADGTIFANRVSGLYRSSDGGITWQFSSKGIRSAAGKLLFVSPDTIYAGYTGSLLRTYNGGADWEKISHDAFERGQFHTIFDHNKLVFTLNDQLYYSNDGGATQTDITPPTGTSGLIVGVHPTTKTFVASNIWRTMRSVDTGQTWTNVSNEIELLKIEFHPTGVVYANGFDSIGSYYSLYKSVDDGQNWGKIASIDSILTFCISTHGKIFVLTHNGLYLSSDNGDTWHKRTLPLSWYWNQSTIITNTQGFLFLNDYSKLYLSVNDGHTWQTLPHLNDLTGFENEFPIRTITLSPDQYLYVTLSNVGTFRSVNSTLTGTFLTGTLRRDSDGECFTPDAQAPLKQWIIKANGEGVHFTNSDSNGGYLMFLDTGAYQISAHPPHLLWWSTCDNDTLAITLDSTGKTYVQDFSALALADCPLMAVSVAASFLRRCFDNTLYVHYCNQGSETADSAWVDVTLDPYLSFVSSAQPYSSLGNNVFRFFLGDVESGECGQFSLVAHVDCDSTVLGQTHCVTARAYPDTLCVAVPNWSGATIEAEVECQDTSVQFRLRNTGNAASQILDYIIIEDDVVLMNGERQYNIGETLTLDRPANGHTWRIESQQEPGHPFSNVAVAFAEGCGGFESLGFINQFNVNTFQPSRNRFCLENIGAYDPNDKQGFPLGFGSEHRIRPGQELDYMIRFQNTGTDTAFNVVIRDTLSAWLDPASVRPGAASHAYTWELSGHGVLSFTFANILLPDSNTNLAASQGFITFKINQQPQVPLQTQIFNSAAIFFDFNPPVITNQTLHTVGLDYLVGIHAPTGFEKQNRVEIFPNPVAESAVFQLKEGIFNQHRIIVTDAFGQKIREAEVSGKQYLFQRKGLPPGAYFFRVENAKGQLFDAGKIILK